MGQQERPGQAGPSQTSLHGSPNIIIKEIKYAFKGRPRPFPAEFAFQKNINIPVHVKQNEMKITSLHFGSSRGNLPCIKA